MIDPDKLDTLSKLRNEAAIDLERARKPWGFSALGAPDLPHRPLTDVEEAEERRLVELIASYDAAIKRELGPVEPTKAEPFNWLQTNVDLASLIVALQAGHRITIEYERNRKKFTFDIGNGKPFIKADSQAAALRQAVALIVRADGEPLDPDSLQAADRNRKAFVEDKRVKQ